MGEKIQLGDKVKCKYSGFTGIAVARTEFINGCVQFTIIPKHDKKSPPSELSISEQFHDEDSLVFVDKKLRKIKKEEEKEPGGASRIVRRKNY